MEGKRKRKRIKYGRIWWEASIDFDLTPIETLLLHLIDGLANNSRANGYCYASKEYFSETLRVSKWTIYSALKKLEDKKLIKRERNELNGLSSQISTTDDWFSYKLGLRENLGGF